LLICLTHDLDVSQPQKAEAVHPRKSTSRPTRTYLSLSVRTERGLRKKGFQIPQLPCSELL
jgi:hypothetical protein